MIIEVPDEPEQDFIEFLDVAQDTLDGPCTSQDEQHVLDFVRSVVDEKRGDHRKTKKLILSSSQKEFLQGIF